MVTESTAKLVLASTSQTRIAMLRAAGLSFQAVPPGVDERVIKDEHRAGGTVDASALALRLAGAKSTAVSLSMPEALVIGADQMLECSGRLFDKPHDRGEAAATLRDLSGQTHALHSAVALSVRGEAVWMHVDVARLTFRHLSEDFIATYLDRCGDAALSSVGAYQIEGLGAQLFERVVGDHFTILGLPLLPLLAELRRRGLIHT